MVNAILATAGTAFAPVDQQYRSNTCDAWSSSCRCSAIT
jgi:hypothetical protein